MLEMGHVFGSELPSGQNKDENKTNLFFSFVE